MSRWGPRPWKGRFAAPRVRRRRCCSRTAAADRPNTIKAVVSRGGRPDLAGPALGRVHAPTLLLVGGMDQVVLALNREALAQLGCVHKQLDVIPGATHLFEEPGTLEKVAEKAAQWFNRWLTNRTEGTVS